jgi:NAD(P)-dependent dehydrogenase (short-subunit alcohol dehydrogenase family)
MKPLLEGRVCVISGAGPGVGRAAALACAREGAQLVLVGRSDGSTAQLGGELETSGARVVAVKADITKAEDRERVVASASKAFGGIDVLINNAFATGRPGAFESSDIGKTWHAPFEVNVIATLQLSQAVIPSMKARGGGAIVMVGTLAAHKPAAGMAGYGASKAALQAAAASLAAEVGRHKIRVNTVVPGHIDGPNLRVFFQMEAKRLGISEEQVYEKIAAEGVLGHIATSEEVAEAVLFFASPQSSAVTGQALHVNAGQFFA